MPTIMDVAARAGVSMKTVSRVLNDEAHVRPQLRARVEQAVAQLGYRPNLAARQLAANRSYLILLLFNSFGASYITRVIVAAAAQCRELDYHLVSEPIDPDEQSVAAIGRTIARLRPEGIILTPPLADDANMLAAIAATSTPLIRISGTRDGYGDTLTVDERPVSRDLVTHLIVEQGHRRIGFVGPRPRHHAAEGRAQGYADALALAGIPYDPELVIAGDFFFQSGFDAAQRLLDLEHPPTAIFAANDGMALGVMSAAAARGLQIPHELAVAGFDDSPASRMVWPSLTSVQLPIDALASRAVQTLVGAKVHDGALHCTLVRRTSTTADPAIAARRFDA